MYPQLGVYSLGVEQSAPQVCPLQQHLHFGGCVASSQDAASPGKVCGSYGKDWFSGLRRNDVMEISEAAADVVQARIYGGEMDAGDVQRIHYEMVKHSYSQLAATHSDLAMYQSTVPPALHFYHVDENSLWPPMVQAPSCKANIPMDLV